MKFVVDTNVLFTFFWKSSVFKKLANKPNLKLFSPEYALEEINRNSEEIIEKTKLSLEEFKNMRKDLAVIVEFIPINEYSSFLKRANLLAENLPKPEKTELEGDIDFFALALKLKCPIWTNDKMFKKQQIISVFFTKEIIELLDKLTNE